jgi:hypothetical protein
MACQVLSLGCLCELSLENNSLGNRGVHCLVDAIKADEVQTLTWYASMPLSITRALPYIDCTHVHIYIYINILVLTSPK